MDLLILVMSGLAIGVIVAAPVGPVNLICIRRTLAFGRLNGFVSGTGAALGDGVFAIVVAFGLTAISSLIEGYYQTIQLLGGLLLLGMGIYTYFSNPRPFVNPSDINLPSRPGDSGLAPAIATTFLLTITNPATLLGFGALFSSWLGHEFMENPTYGSATLMVGSVIAGSMLWWAALTSLMGYFQNHMTYTRLKLLNQISGGVIALLGALVFGQLIMTRLF